MTVGLLLILILTD